MLPACGAAALPFEKWTGTINFRFQIVCSAYHKGRFKVVYDPNYVSENEYNTMYTEVIDIAEKTDFTISVSNGQQITWLDHLVPGVNSVSEGYSTSTYTSKTQGNGVLAIYTVNELTVPNSTVPNDISINVFVSAGDDFEVIQPSDRFARYTFKPQSGNEHPDVEGTSEMHATEQTISSSIGPSQDTLTNVASVYYGESIRSFRPLLKRYNLHECIGPLVGTPSILTNIRAQFPYYRGAVDGAVHIPNSATTALPYNFVNTLLLHWVTMMHSGYRGSIRYKVLPRGNIDSSYVNQIERYDFDTGDDPYFSVENTVVAYTTVGAAARTAVIGDKMDAPYSRSSLTGMNGMARIHTQVNPNMEYELPYYSENRFTPGKLLNQTTNASDYSKNPGAIMRTLIDGTNATLLDIYAAAGEDFQVYFFTGMPPLYYEFVPPPT